MYVSPYSMETPKSLGFINSTAGLHLETLVFSPTLKENLCFFLVIHLFFMLCLHSFVACVCGWRVCVAGETELSYIFRTTQYVMPLLFTRQLF